REDGEEFLLEAFGNGASASGADGDAIDRAQRRDFGGSAGEEDFVGNVEQLARNHLLGDANAKIFAERHDAAAGDARQDARSERGRIDDAVADNENIFAGTFADVS